MCDASISEKGSHWVDWGYGGNEGKEAGSWNLVNSSVKFKAGVDFRQRFQEPYCPFRDNYLDARHLTLHSFFQTITLTLSPNGNEFLIWRCYNPD